MTKGDFKTSPSGLIIINKRQVEACGLLQFAAMFFFSERRKEEERTQSFKNFIEDFKNIFSGYTHTYRYIHIHIHTCTDTSYILIHTYTVVHRHT